MPACHQVTLNARALMELGRWGMFFFGFAQEDRVVSCPGLHIAGKLPGFTAC